MYPKVIKQGNKFVGLVFNDRGFLSGQTKKVKSAKEAHKEAQKIIDKRQSEGE